MVPLVEVQSSRTQRPSTGTSYPYVDLTLGDINTQRVVQLQLEQVIRQNQTGNAAEDKQCFSVEFSGACVSSYAGPGAVPSHRHAGGKHDVRAG